MSVSTHVLDTATGRPAAGLSVRLARADGTVVTERVTGADGRVADLAGDLTPEVYRLTFDVVGYAGEDAFYPEVVIAFRISDPAAHLVARSAGGPQALTAREALRMATAGGARCLGREDEIGSLEPGKLADVAVWRVDGLAGAGIADPIATLVLGPPRLDSLCVGGRAVVTDGRLATADPDELAAAVGRSAAAMREGR